MSYSGTISQTRFTTDKVLASAVRRCRVPAAQISSESWDIAQNELFLFLGNLANQGAPLWCIQKQLYPLYEGVGALTLDIGTVDVMNSFFRTLPQVTGTVTDTATTHTVQFTSATQVTTVGVLWSAAAVPLAFEKSPDGVVWVTAQTETPEASIGQLTWFDMDSSAGSLWFRVRATTGVLGFSQIYLGNNPTEIPLARMNRDDWTNLPNKYFQSDRTLQFWFDRQTPQPIMRMWPIPNLAATNSIIVVWRHRQIMDVGTLSQEIECPQRWYDAVVSGLAARLAREMIEVDPKVIPQLDADAATAMSTAQAEERDNSPIYFNVDLSMYNA